MRKLILAALLGLMAGLWEAAVAPMLPTWLNFHPLLALVVLLLIGSGRSRALSAALTGSLLIDAYAVGSFDAAIIRWIILVFMLDLLVRHLLTNRSLTAALALVLAGRVAERLLSWILGGSLSALGWILLWDVLAVAVGFLALTFFTKRFFTVMHRI